MTPVAQLLSICYLFVVFACILKVFRCYFEYRSTRQKFRLIGIAVSVALGATAALISVGIGHNPPISGEVLKIAIRASFAVYAVLALSFELVYASSFISIRHEQRKAAFSEENNMKLPNVVSAGILAVLYFALQWLSAHLGEFSIPAFYAPFVSGFLTMAIAAVAKWNEERGKLNTEEAITRGLDSKPDSLIKRIMVK